MPRSTDGAHPEPEDWPDENTHYGIASMAGVPGSLAGNRGPRGWQRGDTVRYVPSLPLSWSGRLSKER